MAKHKNRSGRGLFGSGVKWNREMNVAWTPEALYNQASRCGSHFFDKETRRFFNSRVTRTYPVDAKAMTYFVESFGGGRTPSGRMYRVGVLKNCKVQILGPAKGAIRGKKYSSSAAASRAAERMAYPWKRKNARRRKVSR